MKLFVYIVELEFLFLFVFSKICCKHFLISKKNSNLGDAVSQISNEIFDFKTKTTSLVSAVSSKHPESFTIKDFKDQLLAKFGNSNTVFRHDTSWKVTTLSGQRKRFTIFPITSFEEFLLIYEKLSSVYFRYNGYFVFVLVNGEIPEIQNIFNLLWKLQIYNVNIIFENEHNEVIIKSYFPFNARGCNEITPVLVDKFKDGNFLNGVHKLYPEKMTNMFNCPIRVSISSSSKPLVFVERLANGSNRFSGRDIKLINTLAESLRFRINYTFFGNEGYVLDNGTAKGPLKTLLDGDADLSISDWWLKNNRKKFFDATNVYVNDQIVFIVPPAREFTPFEKLFYPFKLQFWILIVIWFLAGSLVIFIVKHCSTKIQRFVFGSGVNFPYFNMFMGFFGGSQHILPKRNFARFLLMMFLMYSLVVRTLYQGSFYQLLQSGRHHRGIQSVNEIIERGFKIYMLPWIMDIFQDTEAFKNLLR